MNKVMITEDIIEVVAKKNEKEIVKNMPMIKWYKLNKVPKWKYIAYQLGFRN